MTAYTEQSVPDQSGKTFFITGANTGIGYEAARVLAERGARVLMGCRSEVKAKGAIERIRKIRSDADVAWVSLDLTSLQSVREAAAVVQNEDQLDVLINNAGVMYPPKTLTEDGFELQFGVNHLGHFLLTALLIDKLKMHEGARVVSVSSIAHRWGHIDFDDPNAEQSYNRKHRYETSKHANMLFMLELDRRLRSAEARCISVACHPGAANTDLTRYLPGWLMLALPLVRPLLNTPAEGALPTLQAATHPTVASGDYYGPVKRSETARSSAKGKIVKHAQDEETAKRLWVMSEKMTGQKLDVV